MRGLGLAKLIAPLAAQGYLSLSDLSNATEAERDALDPTGNLERLSEGAKEDTVLLEIPPRLFEVTGEAAKLIELEETGAEALSYRAQVVSGGVGGTKRGDILVAIAGAPVKGLSFDDVKAMRREAEVKAAEEGEEGAALHFVTDQRSVWLEAAKTVIEKVKKRDELTLGSFLTRLGLETHEKSLAIFFKDLNALLRALEQGSETPDLAKCGLLPGERHRLLAAAARLRQGRALPQVSQMNLALMVGDVVRSEGRLMVVQSVAEEEALTKICVQNPEGGYLWLDACDVTLADGKRLPHNIAKPQPPGGEPSPPIIVEETPELPPITRLVLPEDSPKEEEGQKAAPRPKGGLEVGDVVRLSGTQDKWGKPYEGEVASIAFDEAGEPTVCVECGQFKEDSLMLSARRMRSKFVYAKPEALELILRNPPSEPPPRPSGKSTALVEQYKHAVQGAAMEESEPTEALGDPLPGEENLSYGLRLMRQKMREQGAEIEADKAKQEQREKAKAEFQATAAQAAAQAGPESLPRPSVTPEGRTPQGTPTAAPQSPSSPTTGLRVGAFVEVVETKRQGVVDALNGDLICVKLADPSKGLFTTFGPLGHGGRGFDGAGFVWVPSAGLRRLGGVEVDI